MRDYETGLTQERLKELLHYDPDTGIFTWKVDRRAGVRAGDIAGSKHYRKNGNRSHINIHINNFRYKAHRLAFLYMDGEWPEIVDHDDHDPFNNKWINLNNGTSLDNNKNCKISSNNTSGVNGVYWRKDINKWYAAIRVNYKIIHLGAFEELHDAVTARRDAEKKYGYHENHGKRKTK